MIRSTKPHPMAEDARREEWVPVLVHIETFGMGSVIVLPVAPGTCGLITLPGTRTHVQIIGVSLAGECVGPLTLVSEMSVEARADALDSEAIAWVPRWLVMDRGLTPMGPAS